MAFVTNDTRQLTLLDSTLNLTGRAKQLQYMQTEEFSQYARFRNGVEAIPSLLRRRYHVDKIPTREKNRTGLHFGFNIAALNFQKLPDYTSSLSNCTQNTKIA